MVTRNHSIVGDRFEASKFEEKAGDCIMSVALKVVDQTLGVHPPITRQLRLVSERTTLREVLKRRIDEEVAELNAGTFIKHG